MQLSFWYSPEDKLHALLQIAMPQLSRVSKAKVGGTIDIKLRWLSPFVSFLLLIPHRTAQNYMGTLEAISWNAKRKIQFSDNCSLTHFNLSWVTWGLKPFSYLDGILSFQLGLKLANVYVSTHHSITATYFAPIPYLADHHSYIANA